MPRTQVSKYQERMDFGKLPTPSKPKDYQSRGLGEGRKEEWVKENRADVNQMY